MEAAARLRVDYPGLRLVLDGSGSEEQALRERASALGLDGSVWFAGQQSDPERFLRMADLYVTPSRMEGLPFNVLEAMAAGLPVVASAVKGHVDLLDGDGSVLLEPDGPDEVGAYARAIGELLADGSRCAAMGAHNRERCMQYDRSVVFPRVADMMSALL
jgi:glycosyltransferase involved in cell wall biosynthesis